MKVSFTHCELQTIYKYRILQSTSGVFYTTENGHSIEAGLHAFDTHSKTVAARTYDTRISIALGKSMILAYCETGPIFHTTGVTYANIKFRYR